MSVSQELISLGLISGKKTGKVFDELYSDILTVDYSLESEFISSLYHKYTPTNPSLNGAVFEGILATVLYRSRILPIYAQVKLAFVPNINFDFVLYSREYGPIIISAKTSLRERYKQADLEGMMLRHVHRKSRSYLITLNESEATLVNDKINSGLVLGIDEVIVATRPKFDEFIATLKSLNYCEPGKIDILTSARVIKGLEKP